MPDLPTTKAGIEVLPLPSTNAVDYRDTRQRALYLRVSPAGTKAWSLRDDRGGRSRRIGLGRFPDLPITLARERAAAMLAQIAGGEDPVEKRRTEREAAGRRKIETVAAVGRLYVQKAAIGRHRMNGKPMRPNSMIEERRYLEKVLIPRLGERSLAELTRIEIQTEIDKIEIDMTPSAARHSRNVLQRVFSYAIWQDIVTSDPTRFVSAPGWVERERVLTDAELRVFWQGLGGVADIEGVSVSPAVVIALKLAALTLQRRGEVIGMRVDEIDREARTWTMGGARTKNGRTHVVPLAAAAMTLVDEALALRGRRLAASPLVFPSTRRQSVPIGAMAVTHAWRRLRTKLAKTTPSIATANVHDLRRTGATNLTSERLGFPRFIVSQVLNHSSDSGSAAAATSIYDRNAYLPEKRRALDAWAALLMEIVEGQKRPENVVRLGT